MRRNDEILEGSAGLLGSHNMIVSRSFIKPQKPAAACGDRWQYDSRRKPDAVELILRDIPNILRLWMKFIHNDRQRDYIFRVLYRALDPCLALSEFKQVLMCWIISPPLSIKRSWSVPCTPRKGLCKNFTPFLEIAARGVWGMALFWGDFKPQVFAHQENLSLVHRAVTNQVGIL